MFDRSPGVLYSTPDGPVGYADIDHIDPESGELVLTWNQRSQDLGVLPSTIVVNGWVRSEPKPTALGELAAKVLDSGPRPSEPGVPGPLATGPSPIRGRSGARRRDVR